VERFVSGWRVGAEFAALLCAFFALLGAVIAFSPGGLSAREVTGIIVACGLSAVIGALFAALNFQELELHGATGVIRVKNVFSAYRWREVRAIDVRVVKHDSFKRGLNPLELRADGEPLQILETRVFARNRGALYARVGRFVREHNPLARVTLE
jgi:hypothetical protein